MRKSWAVAVYLKANKLNFLVELIFQTESKNNFENLSQIQPNDLG